MLKAKKDVICKHCKAVNSHNSFQCFSIRKPIKTEKKPINKVGAKRKKKDVVYARLSVEFKLKNPYCMARLPGCMGMTSDVHHLFSGANRDKYYLVVKTWITVCPYCHHLIHDVLSKDELIAKGLKLTE